MQIYTFFINDNNIFIHTLPPWHPNAVSEAENRLTGTRHCCISLLAKPSALPKNISVYQQFEKNIAKLFGHIEKSVYFCSLNHNETGSFGRGARHRSAKPATPVQIRKRPQTIRGSEHRTPCFFPPFAASPLHPLCIISASCLLRGLARAPEKPVWHLQKEGDLRRRREFFFAMSEKSCNFTARKI